MAGPFDYSQSLTSVPTKSRLQLLAADSGKGLGAIDLGSGDRPYDVLWNILEVKTDTAGTPVWAAGDFIEFYLGSSDDDVTWAMGLDPDSATDHGADVRLLRPLAQLAPATWTAAGGDVIEARGLRSTLDVLGVMVLPRWIGLFCYVLNAAATADERLTNTAADHIAQYKTIPWAA